MAGIDADESAARPRADHALSAQLLRSHTDDAEWLSTHVPGCVHSWLDGYTCAYCELPVRTDGDCRHPGYAVVERAGGGAVDDPEASLRVLHRFCNRMAKAHLPGKDEVYGLALRRAWLGWATGQFLAGVSQARHFGARHYERLGLHPNQLRNPALFKKHWLVRKMRCASQAIHYYAGANRPTGG
jgi:hypothetical protein